MTRTTVVTGAARGLGESIARMLDADGDRVLLARRPQPRLVGAAACPDVNGGLLMR